MEHDQKILGGSRSACSIAIFLIWMLEALFVLSLITMVLVNALGMANFLNANWSDPVVIMAVSVVCAVAVFLSFAFCSFIVAVLANTIANIDSRNFQLEQLLLDLQHNQEKSYIAPARSQRSVDMDSMRIRAERVT